MPLCCACDIIPVKLWEGPGRLHIGGGSVTMGMEPDTEDADTGTDSHEERDDWNDRNSSLIIPRSSSLEQITSDMAELEASRLSEDEEAPDETFVLSPVFVDLVVTVGGRWLPPKELRRNNLYESGRLEASRKKRGKKIVRQ